MTLCHLNLARGYRGGERQTQLLLEGLSGRGVEQVLVARAGEPLAERMAGTPGLEVRPARGLLTALRETRRASLVHAHDGRSVHVASARERISGTPYLLTPGSTSRRGTTAGRGGPTVAPHASCRSPLRSAASWRTIRRTCASNASMMRRRTCRSTRRR